MSAEPDFAVTFQKTAAAWSCLTRQRHGALRWGAGCKPNSRLKNGEYQAGFANPKNGS